MSVWIFAPQAYSRVSNINIDIWNYFGGTLYISDGKLATDGKVLSHLGFMSMVLHTPFTDVNAWSGIYTSSQQQGVKYQILYLDFVSGNLYISVVYGYRSSHICGGSRSGSRPEIT